MNKLTVIQWLYRILWYWRDGRDTKPSGSGGGLIDNNQQTVPALFSPIFPTMLPVMSPNDHITLPC